MTKEARSLLRSYHIKWDLQPDGPSFSTHCACLQPVIYKGRKAMLKITEEKDEKYGAGLMVRWNGAGAAQVYRYDNNALLLEFAHGSRSLKQMAQSGKDAEATQIICGVIAAQHRQYPGRADEGKPLKDWFKDLFRYGEKHGGIIYEDVVQAKHLLDHQQEETLLHGDIHHENILDSERGWLVIDPKRLYGDRAFEYVNIFCNPERKTATNEACFRHRLEMVSHLSGIGKKRLLQWILAWCSLSATWLLNDQRCATMELQIARLASDYLIRLAN